MSEEFKIINTTPANPGWWLMFEDEQGSCFYHPVAVWARCATACPDGEGVITTEFLHPMIPTFHGLLTVPELVGSRLLYLPDAKFIPVINNNSPGYYRTEGGQ